MLSIEIHKAIRAAIKQGHLEEVVKLIGTDKTRLNMMTPFGTWLHVAAAHGKTDIARWLVTQGLSVNAPGGTIEGAPIHRAASDGHYDVVKYLLDCGAILDVSEPLLNPLFGAIYGGHTDIAKLLIDSGIDATISYTGENMNNMDAIAFANEWGRHDIVAMLEAKK